MHLSFEICSLDAYLYNSMYKSERQKAILRVIKTSGIRRQGEIAGVLRGQGFVVTQASVSRDLDDLGIVKVNGVYTFPEANRGGPFGTVEIRTAGDSLVVARCSSGLASAAAVTIDAAGISEIVGTIAGDDTIFIAVEGSEAQAKVLSALHGMFASAEAGGKNADKSG